ncbi:MAG: aminoacyl-tRNA hydrolase [Mariprofundaceae bacterium]
MHLIVGLGNPGRKYTHTRHNAGFRLLDRLAESEGLRFSAAPRFRAEIAEWTTEQGKALLVKPQTFMNHSGEAVGAVARYHHVPTDRIVVAYDDLDLPPARIRLRHGGGHGGHNGLKSLNQHLPDANYIRIRIGIGRPPAGMEVTPWVLGRATSDELAEESRLFDAILAEMPAILAGRLPEAANRIHLALNPPAGKPPQPDSKEQ